MRIILLLFIIHIPILSSTAFGANGPIQIEKSTNKLNFDGLCDEDFWNSLDPIEMQMYRPNHGSKPTEHSEIFVTFDDKYFYLGGRLHYSSKASVKATTKKRDGSDGGSDNFGILLDSFNDNENALCFETNPSGLRSDFSISNDAQTVGMERPFNRSWNTFWDVKTSIKGKVWHVEIRIPLSSLRFQEEDGKVVMGMSVWRSIISKQEWSVFPLLTNEFGMFGIWKPSQAQKIELVGMKMSNPVFVTPYALAGIEQLSEMNENGTGYRKINDHKLTAGLDLKYALTSNLTMDLTLNTDFAQVEVDDQMVNLTRFSLFFPEKRQFFLERSSIFTIRTGYLDQLFYSRRIGIYEGEIVPIYGGARLVGRAGKWDLGFLNMQTASIDYYNEDEDRIEVVPSTNYGVYRARKQVFNERSYAGGMVTSKIDLNGNYNINTAIDLIWNPFRNDYITANYIQTFDSGIDYNHNVFDYSKFYFNWENRSNVGFRYDVLLSHGGKYYDPQLGFELMDDYSRAFAMVGYGWVYNEPKNKILSQQVSLWSWTNKRNEDWSTEVSRNSLMYNFSLKSGLRSSIGIMYSHENLKELFELSDDVYFEPGSYDYTMLEGSISTPSNKLFALRAQFSGGQYFDGRHITVGPAEIFFRPSPSVRLGVDYQYTDIDVKDRKQHYNTHLARLKTDFTFTTKLSLLMYFQYSSSDKFGVNNIRFRYNPKEGNDLYLVYNGEYNSHLNREDPHLPGSETNSLQLKYTYTFIWGK